MNENMKSQIYAVLEKYDKPYSEDGVNTNLQIWKKNKGGLIDLLRRHPNWNEDELAIVFEVTYSRKIEKELVYIHKNELSRLIWKLEIPEKEQKNFYFLLETITSTYSKTLSNKNIASIIQECGGVNCSVGQKNSRIIHAVCSKYGLDKLPEYNARFAKLADSLNPIKIKRTALLSVHPCDFLEMSNRYNSWHSCHCLEDGEYHGGTLSYMNDASSMVFYTLDDDETDAFHTAAKRTRQIFCYQNGILLQSRLYPQTNDEDTRDQYRNIVQQAIAACLQTPNLWTLKRDIKEVKKHVNTYLNALHYSDYEYSNYHPNISLLKSSFEKENHLMVGYTAYCLECSRPVYSHDSLYCEACCDENHIHCFECGQRVHIDDSHLIDGNEYCDDCCSYCNHCSTYTCEDTTEVKNSRGFSIDVCPDCLKKYYSYCISCNKYVPNESVENIHGKCHCKSCAKDLKPESEENAEDYPVSA